MSESTPLDKSKQQDPAKEEFDRGEQFMEMGDYGQAANCFHNALLDYKERNDEKAIANTSDKIAEVCFAREQFDKAVPHIDRAFAICKKEGDELSMTALKKKYAQAYQGSGQYQKAIETYLDLLDVYYDFKDPRSAVRTLESMSETYLSMGDKKAAADALRSAASIHRNFKHARHAEELEEKAAKIDTAN